MKKLLLYILLLGLSFTAKSQFPISQSQGSPSTQVFSRGAYGSDSGFVYRTNFADTATANLSFLKNIPGIQIRIGDGNWQRSQAANRWIQQVTMSNISTILGCYGLQKGGVVTWSGTGYIMDVSMASYFINCNFYTSAQAQVTLAASHPTLNRIDVIYVNTSGQVGVLTGVPGVTPTKPQVNPSTQLELTFINVDAASTEPGGVTQTIVYDENLGTPTEWAYTSGLETGTSNPASTNNPFHLTINNLISSGATGVITWTAAAPVTVSNYTTLKLYVRLEIPASAVKTFINVYLSSSGLSSAFTLNILDYGFNPDVIGSYQLITIPIQDFAYGATTFDGINFNVSTSSQVHFDYIQLQGGIPTGSSPYITDVFRKPGTDSVFQVRDGIAVFAFRDSTGGGGGSQTWQQTLITGSNLTQDNYVDANNNDFWLEHSSDIFLQAEGTDAGFSWYSHVNLWSGYLDLQQTYGNGVSEIAIQPRDTYGEINLYSKLGSTSRSDITIRDSYLRFTPYIGRILIDSLNRTTDSTGFDLMVRNRLNDSVKIISSTLIGTNQKFGASGGDVSTATDRTFDFNDNDWAVNDMGTWYFEINNPTTYGYFNMDNDQSGWSHNRSNGVSEILMNNPSGASGHDIILKANRTGAFESKITIGSDSLSLSSGGVVQLTSAVGDLKIDSLTQATDTVGFRVLMKNRHTDRVQEISAATLLTMAGGSTALSALTAATATNTIDNAAYQQRWNFNSLTNGTGLYLASNSTVGSGTSQILFRSGLTGTNASSGIATTAGAFSNGKGGTGAINTSLYSTASNGATNYALFTDEGDVLLNQLNGITQIGKAGTTLGQLKMSGNTSGTVTIQPAAAAGTYTLTLPTTDGASGEFLQTDGSGVLSWAAGGGSSGITVGTTTITSGTSGAIPFNNAGVYGEDATQLFWDNSNNWLGVGTNTPSSPIDVIGGSGTGDNSIRGFTLGTSNTSYPTKGRWATNFNGNYITQNAYYNGASWVNDNGGVASSGIIMSNFSGSEGVDINLSAIGASASNGGINRLRISLTELVINDPSENYDVRIEGDTDANLFFTDASTDRVGIGTNSPSVQFHVTGAVRLAGIGGAGAVTSDASGNLSVTSDGRLKFIEGEYSAGLKEIMQLTPVTYKWRPESGMETKYSYAGFDAREVHGVLGELGAPTNKNGYYSLQDRAILGALVSGMKEQQKMIEELKEEIQKLKQK